MLKIVLFLNLVYPKKNSYLNGKRSMLFQSIDKGINKNCKIIGLCCYYQYAARYLRDWFTIVYSNAWLMINSFLKSSLVLSQGCPVLITFYLSLIIFLSFSCRFEISCFFHISNAFDKIWHKGTCIWCLYSK